MIPIARPHIGDEEKRAVLAVLDSGQLASGPKVHEFEEAFARYCDSPQAVACSSGTAALCTAMLALDLPAGSRALTTPFSFIATANCVLNAGCVPVFADVDRRTFNLTAAAVEEALDRDPSIRAVIPVHLYGQACEIAAMVEVCKPRGVRIIEDGAQSHGATDGDVPVGAIGDLGVFSFYPTKNMTCGEGGAICGADEELLERCRLIIDHGAPERYRHELLGFNFRMTSIAAAIGMCQLDRLPQWNAERLVNGRALTAGLAGLPGIETPLERPGCTHVYDQYVIIAERRDALQEHLHAAGIGTAIHYPRMIPEQPLYQRLGYSGDDLPVASELCRSVLSLPVHPALSPADLDAVVAGVRGFVEA
jgi:perosamine synthetase